MIEIPKLSDPRVLRHVTFLDSLRLLTWDTGRTEGSHHQVGYAFYQADQLLFVGEDFGNSPVDAIDSDMSIVQLLGFLPLKKGDTDLEYFVDYTEDQLNWSESSKCQELGLILADADEEISENLVWVEVAGAKVLSYAENWDPVFIDLIEH